MSESSQDPDAISFDSLLQGVEAVSGKNFVQEFQNRTLLYRQGQLSFEELASWCEELIVEKREKARFWVEDCQTEVYLSFAQRAAERAHQTVESLEQGFECIIAFLDGGEDSLLDDALPFFEEAVKGIYDVINLNEECMELDGGVTGKM